MMTYTLQADLRGPFDGNVRHMHCVVQREWPSVPRVGDLVTLDDETGWALPVGAVAFMEDRVTLHFFECSERDIHALTIAGFEPF